MESASAAAWKIKGKAANQPANQAKIATKAEGMPAAAAAVIPPVANNDAPQNAQLDGARSISPVRQRIMVSSGERQCLETRLNLRGEMANLVGLPEIEGLRWSFGVWVRNEAKAVARHRPRVATMIDVSSHDTSQETIHDTSRDKRPSNDDATTAMGRCCKTPPPARMMSVPVTKPMIVARIARENPSVILARLGSRPDRIEKLSQPTVTSLWAARRTIREPVRAITRQTTVTAPKAARGTIAAMSAEKTSRNTWINRLPKTPAATRLTAASGRLWLTRRRHDEAIPRHGRAAPRNIPHGLLFEGSRAM